VHRVLRADRRTAAGDGNSGFAIRSSAMTSCEPVATSAVMFKRRMHRVRGCLQKRADVFRSEVDVEVLLSDRSDVPNGRHCLVDFLPTGR
jgi:hypothetical protein